MASDKDESAAPSLSEIAKALQDGSGQPLTQAVYIGVQDRATTFTKASVQPAPLHPDREPCPACGMPARRNPGGGFNRHRDREGSAYAWCYGQSSSPERTS